MSDATHHAESIMPAIARHTSATPGAVTAMAHVLCALSETSVSTGLWLVRHDPTGDVDRERTFGTEDARVDAALAEQRPFVLPCSSPEEAGRIVDLILASIEIGDDDSYTALLSPDGVIGITTSGNEWFDIDGRFVRPTGRDGRTTRPVEPLAIAPKPEFVDQVVHDGDVMFDCVARMSVPGRHGKSDKAWAWEILASSRRSATAKLRELAEGIRAEPRNGMGVYEDVDVTCRVSATE